jgi:hypothetical protein
MLTGIVRDDVCMLGSVILPPTTKFVSDCSQISAVGNANHYTGVLFSQKCAYLNTRRLVPTGSELDPADDQVYEMLSYLLQYFSLVSLTLTES